MAKNFDEELTGGRRVRGKDDIAIRAVGYILIGVFALICVIPFYLIIVASFTDEASLIRNGYPLIPTDFSIESYRLSLKNPTSILMAYGVTIGVTFFGTLLAVLLASMTGYVLSRRDFPWRNKFSFFFFFTTLFNGGLVPWYILCVRYLHMKNSIWALILPLMFSVWNMIIAKSFMKGIPFEITEAAKIDGAGDFFIYMRIILPMAKPLVATLTLFIALAYWNDWYNCMLFMSGSDNWNLQYTLQNILNSSEALKRIANQTGMQVGQMPSEGLKLAMTVIATGPIVLLYPFLQKYFVKGLTLGAVKG